MKKDSIFHKAILDSPTPATPVLLGYDAGGQAELHQVDVQL